MSMRLTQVALAGLFLTLGVRDAAAEVMRWQIDGETREAIVYVPASPGREGAPLVLAFHGFGDNMQNFQYTPAATGSTRPPLALLVVRGCQREAHDLGVVARDHVAVGERRMRPQDRAVVVPPAV